MASREDKEMPGRNFRCMAEARNGEWWAICIDLDIAVQGQSFPEVQKSLHQAIDMYLARVVQLPANEQRPLLYRRAPWHVMAKYVVLSAFLKLRSDGGNSHRSFVISEQAQASA